ncbi:NAD-dependent epimerase/dehydratase family protein [Variovorax paradoxus]|jgi:nucleoside-diphosphate-sugar epimerase|uniref:NAD-dependent epimerase/dehydratase family protein n=1 Tax=Variovorax paradoxus TaxID=34073 RepID=UPI0029C74B36|nr:NAD-dependent epimerase/dehydratase family protein [Variovorax paradoxus]WPH24199.1 NAD-dependent epimerase/dehydratase family protein [Variovorax paradoxus]
MRVLITGGGGFIGAHLADLLRERGELGGRRIGALALADQALPETAGETAIRGDLTQPAVMAKVATFRPDVVFHLAAVPGGASEADYALGRRVNLDASLSLFEALAASGTRPTVVYASSIAVYGTDLPDLVTPRTPLRPPLTYGAHKQVCEILLADFTRRGLLDGRSVRLPGIVARAKSSAGLSSAFMSDILHALKAGETFTCPVGPEATAWWMSAQRCAENLVHAAVMDASRADPGRAWPLPVLRLSIGDIIDTCSARYGESRRGLVSFQPRPDVEAVFGRYPRLDDASARALGLRDDGSADDLVRRALGEIN